jgi:hypothetical protein
MKNIFTFFLCVFFSLKLTAQVNYTANDPQGSPTYTNFFLFGSNMGYYGTSWDDGTIADIAAGNTAVGVKGAGVKSVRPSLYEDFLETWGYNIRVDQFNHYASLGMQDLTVFLGTPVSAAHKDNNTYGGCSTPSLLFANMYQPIWDNGENGTPVNDNNYFALYVYKTVSMYKNQTKFWEIINEPDQDGGADGWKAAGTAGNWFENTPTPCELINLRAPVYQYIRLLRIAYEVIKTVDPTAYVAPGGLGYSSFLDVLLRNTDNPTDGSVTADYPNKGGAYFDCLSFHSYPIYDLAYWDGVTGTVKYKRHSDACADSYIGAKKKFDDVFAKYGYNGTTYPQKTIICTETNIPGNSTTTYFGGIEVQRNYIIKAIVESQMNGISQMYIYGIGNNGDYATATNGYDVMGLYQKLAGIGPLTNGGVYNQQYTDEGIAYKTTSDVLYGYKYDAAKTTSLNLPATVNGGAFKNGSGKYVYVLWARTTIDSSEVANANYTFPAGIVSATVSRKEWNYTATSLESAVSSINIPLTGAPSFFTDLTALPLIPGDTTSAVRPENFFGWSVYPNPVRSNFTISVNLKQRQEIAADIYSATGALVQTVIQPSYYATGDHTFNVTVPSRLAAGSYFVRLRVNSKPYIKQVVVVK